jgi:hypothetical protein
VHDPLPLHSNLRGIQIEADRERFEPEGKAFLDAAIMMGLLDEEGCQKVRMMQENNLMLGEYQEFDRYAMRDGLIDKESRDRAMREARRSMILGGANAAEDGAPSSAPAPGRPAPKPAAGGPRPKPAAAPAATGGGKPAPAEGKSGGGGGVVMVILVLLIAGAAGAYFAGLFDSFLK